MRRVQRGRVTGVLWSRRPSRRRRGSRPGRGPRRPQQDRGGEEPAGGHRPGGVEVWRAGHWIAAAAAIWWLRRRGTLRPTGPSRDPGGPPADRARPGGRGPRRRCPGSGPPGAGRAGRGCARGRVRERARPSCRRRGVAVVASSAVTVVAVDPSGPVWRWALPRRFASSGAITARLWKAAQLQCSGGHAGRAAEDLELRRLPVRDALVEREEHLHRGGG